MFAIKALVVALLVSLGSTSPSPKGRKCATAAGLVDFDDFDAEYLNSTYYKTGEFQLVGAAGTATNEIPFCEIHGAIKYAEGAQLVFTVWLPNGKDYQGRFQSVGSGGYGGIIDRESMLSQLNSGLGFALAGGDAGHDAWAETNGTTAGYPGLYIPFLNHKERTEAWIHNAISLFTPLTRQIVSKYYGGRPKYSYFNGCSAGGAQGFALADYHPDLYDGIFAGSPANYQSHLWLSATWNEEAQPAEGPLSTEVLAFVMSSALDRCDALDGVTDGLIENPTTCPFKVEALRCEKGEKPADDDGSIRCLTKAQVKSFRSIYDGPQTSDTGEKIHPGYYVGSETNWIIPVVNKLADNFALPMLQNLVYKDLEWNRTSFRWTKAEVARVDRVANALTNAIGTNLTKFRGHGGKILTTQGWADPLLTPYWPIQYRARLQAALAKGETVDDFFRLFMVPGGGHCEFASLAPAPTKWHVMEPLIQWVERDRPPASVLASNPGDGSGRTRKLCPWPETARFVGGDPDDWESFACSRGD